MWQSSSMGMRITQNHIHVQIKNRLNSENACYFLVQNLLASHALSKNLKIKIYKTNFTCCENWSLAL